MVSLVTVADADGDVAGLQAPDSVLIPDCDVGADEVSDDVDDRLDGFGIGLRFAARSAGERFPARLNASPGCTIDRMKSASAICSYDASDIPAAWARATVAAERPASSVRT